jgi:hypothetical protein
MDPDHIDRTGWAVMPRAPAQAEYVLFVEQLVRGENDAHGYCPSRGAIDQPDRLSL